MTLINTTELGNHLGKSLTGDSRAKQVVDSVNQWVNNYIGRLYGVPTGGSTVTEMFDYQPVVFLSNMNIISVTSMKLFGETVDVSKYKLNKETGRLIISRNNLGYPSLVVDDIDQLDAIEITYKAGVVTVPADLKLACLQLAADNYNKRDADGTAGVTRASVGGLDLSFATDNTAQTAQDGSHGVSDYMSVFNYYKRHRVG